MWRGKGDSCFLDERQTSRCVVGLHSSSILYRFCASSAEQEFIFQRTCGYTYSIAAQQIIIFEVYPING